MILRHCCLLQQDDFIVVRLAMEEGISQTYMDNDMILLSKDDPNVSRHTYAIQVADLKHQMLGPVMSACINVMQI